MNKESKSSTNRWEGVKDETRENLYAIANSRPTSPKDDESTERLIDDTREDIERNYRGNLQLGLRVELDAATLCFEQGRSDIGLGFQPDEYKANSTTSRQPYT